MKIQMTVTWKDWNVGSTSDGKTCIAHPFRVINGKHYHGELYGKEFKNSDEAFKAMHAQGYTQVYYSRSSVVLGCFKGLASVERQAKFDALYRLWKWKKKHGKTRVCLEKQLCELAKEVGIFHPATKQFRSK